MLCSAFKKSTTFELIIFALRDRSLFIARGGGVEEMKGGDLKKFLLGKGGGIQ